MQIPNLVAKRNWVSRTDMAAMFSYLSLSLADGITTILDRTLVGTPEATPGYRDLMSIFGDGVGFALALGIEYLLIFSLHRISPGFLKPLIFVIPAVIHCFGCLAHIDILTGQLPPGIDTVVWTCVRFLNDFGQGLAGNATAFLTLLK